MEENAGGSGSIAGFLSGEDVISHALLVFSNVKAFCLQIKHGAIAAAKLHQLIMSTQLNHAAVFQHADAVCMADSRKAMRDQDRGAMARCSQQAIKDFRFAANVELCSGLIEQHNPGA